MAAPGKSDSPSADVIELTKELRDPYVVFYDEDVLTPVPDAQPVSSLEEFADMYLRCKRQIEETEAVVAVLPPPPVAQQEAPLGGGGRQRRTLPSVVERSTAGGLHSTGPLSVLFRAVRDRLRVKVWTRSHTRVRSILTAFVQAYDRHVNLALADVDEVLLLPEDRPPPTQPAPEAAEPRAPPADPLVLRLPSWTPGWTDTAPPESPVGCPTTASSGSCPPPGRSLRKTTACIPLEPTGAGPPLGDPRRRRRKKRTGRRRPAPPLLAARARHVGQLFVRGDNVVSVALLPV
ncbi:uncharacterized protein LOC144128554 isoform X1 [Amblyomma americanum]